MSRPAHESRVPTGREQLADADGDWIWPGSGVDEADAGKGDDRFFLRADGAADKITCGPGDDTVVYIGPEDAADILAGCEKVKDARADPMPPDDRPLLGMRVTLQPRKPAN